MFVYCLCLCTVFFSWYVCRKMLTWYLRNQVQSLETFYARRSTTSSWLLCDQTTRFDRKLFCSPCTSKRETVAGVLFGSYTMVGSQVREGNWTSNLSECTCCRCQSYCSLFIDILPWSKLSGNYFPILCTGGIVVVGWNVGKCNILMEKVSAAPLSLWCHLCPGCEEYMADQLVLDFWL